MRNPEKYVLSANVHRRHLTPEQKREAIAAFIKADPKASDRKVGKALKVDGKTVASVREQAGRNAETPQSGHLPIERAEAAAVANPEASANAIAKIANVSRDTAQKAKKAAAAEPKVKPEPPPPAAATTPQQCVKALGCRLCARRGSHGRAGGGATGNKGRHAKPLLLGGRPNHFLMR